MACAMHQLPLVLGTSYCAAKLSLLCFVFHTRSKLVALQLQRRDHYIFFCCAVSQSAHAVVDFMISSKSKLIPGVEIRT
jgi:hypothetical protein